MEGLGGWLSVKRLPCKGEVLTLVPRTHTKYQAWWYTLATAVLGAGEAETGAAGFPVQPNQLALGQDRPHLKGGRWQS